MIFFFICLVLLSAFELVLACSFSFRFPYTLCNFRGLQKMEKNDHH